MFLFNIYFLNVVLQILIKIDFFPCNEINKYETSSEDASSYI